MIFQEVGRKNLSAYCLEASAAGKHFVSDVLVGYVLGALVVDLIPEVHRAH